MKKLFFAALAATTLFASCAKEGNNNRIPEGENTKMGLSFSFAGTATRAISDANATADEMKVDKVTVFIFDETGAAVTGNGTVVDIADFDATVDNVYTLNNDAKIETTTGVRRIYVGMNLPTTMNEFTSESELKTAIVIDMDELAAATGMAMFSTEVIEQALVLEEDGDNLVEVEVERMVAKVGASFGAGKTAEFIIADDATFTVTTFGIGQEATSMYPLKRFDSAGKLVTPGLRNAVPSTTNWNDVDDAGTATTSLATYYVGENASAGNLRGEVTYAVFQATFVPVNWTTIDNGALLLVENEETSPIDTWVVKDGDVIYYCEDIDTAEDVMAYLIDVEGSVNPQVIEYAGGYCYYNVYLNAGTATKYQLFRNDFIHLEINDVTGLGYPGDPDEGGEEPDPTEPKDPELPVDPEATNMLVKVTVKKWNYGAVGTILQ